MLKAVEAAINDDKRHSETGFAFKPSGKDSKAEVKNVPDGEDDLILINKGLDQSWNPYGFEDFAFDDAVVAWEGQYRDEFLLYLVKTFGPIKVDSLYKAIAKRYGNGRVTKEVKAQVAGFMRRESASLQNRARQGEDAVLMSKDMGEVTPRVAGSRAIGDIPLIELEKDVSFITSNIVGTISREDLIRETANALGFHRSGKQIQEALNRAIDNARRRQMIPAGKVMSAH